MNPEDSIRMLMEDQAKWQAMMDNYAELELRNRQFSDAEREEAQAKYLRRLQEPFIYRGRPDPIRSEGEIGYEVPYGAHPGQKPPLPYDFKGM